MNIEVSEDSDIERSTSNFDGLVKSLQGRHSRERGSDENGEISTFYEFINFEWKKMKKRV